MKGMGMSHAVILVAFIGPKTYQLKDVQTFTVFIIKFRISEVHQFTVVKMALHVAIIIYNMYN